MKSQHAGIHGGSTNLSYSDDKQGFGAGKAIAVALVFGPIGLGAGVLINRKRRHVHVRCNGCFQVFTADKLLAVERQIVKRETPQRDLATASTPGIRCVQRARGRAPCRTILPGD